MAVVLTLAKLKLTLLGRSITGSQGAWIVAGAVIGVCLALGTVALSALYSASEAILGDLLGVVYALWMAGWIVGPVWGGAPLVRTEHFALIPLPRRQLTLGLLGAATGIVLYGWLGRLGYRRLVARGPELLLTMRVGRSSKPQAAGESTLRVAGSHADGQPTARPTGQKAAIIGFGIPLAAILLFPQGIVPAVLKLAHARARVWFLPLYLPKPLQWPACFVMMALGVAVACLVLWTVRQTTKSAAEQVAEAVTHVRA